MVWFNKYFVDGSFNFPTDIKSRHNTTKPMITDYALLGLITILILGLFRYQLIPLKNAVILFAFTLAYGLRYHIYYQWLNMKETDAFQQKMGSIIEEINRQEAPAIETIPRIIIQIWVQKDPKSPKKIPVFELDYMKRFKTLNPSFQHMFFEDDDVDTFFKQNYPEYYSTYQQLPAFIQKLDFFRYLVIYHYGGFYFDMDVEPHKPLDDAVLNHSAIFPIDEYANDLQCKSSRMKSLCLVGQNFLLGQYAFGAVAKHPFFKMMVDKIHRNVQNYVKIYQQIQNVDREAVHYYVYKTTGPDFVTDCYVEYPNKHQFYILSNGRRQVFGDYGTHKYVGVWK